MDLKKICVFGFFSLTLIFSTPITVFAGSTIVIEDDFNKSLRKWDITGKNGGSISHVKSNSGKVVRVRSSNKGSENFTHLIHKLKENEIKGQYIRVEFKFKGENIDAGSRDYHGIHLDLEVKPPKGKKYVLCYYVWQDSTDWTEESFECDVPAEIDKIFLRVGLQGTNGVAYFDDIKIWKIE